MNTAYGPENIEVVFRTPDGVVHKTLKEAFEHTPPSPPEPEYEMWTSNKQAGIFGTEDIHQATLVYLPHIHATENFIHDSQLVSSNVENINGPGWYVWNPDYLSWVLMPEGFDALFDGLRF